MLSKVEDRQQVLEEFDELARLESVCALLVRETELAGVEKKVQARVRKQIEQNQKDYFLREQIKAIQTEPGDKDATDVEELRERLTQAGMQVSEITQLRALAEQITGTPAPLPPAGRVIAKVIGRDGTLLDTIGERKGEE